MVSLMRDFVRARNSTDIEKELAGQGVRAATLELGSKDERHDLVQLMVDAVGSGETRVDALFVSGLEFGDTQSHAKALERVADILRARSDVEEVPAYQQYKDGKLFIVRWRRPTTDAAQKLAEEVLGHSQRIGQPLLLGVIIGPDCAVPDAATREALLRGHDQVYDSCSSIRMVFLGGTLRQTAMRSVVTGMVIAVSMRGKGVEVERSAVGLASSVGELLGTNPHMLLDNLVAAGILDAAGLGSRW